MTVSALVKEINQANLSVEDLRILNQLIVRNIKAQRKSQALQNATKLHEGMVVRVNHDKLAGQTGKITKIKRTKCDIYFASMGISYTVPMSLVHGL